MTVSFSGACRSLLWAAVLVAAGFLQVPIAVSAVNNPSTDVVAMRVIDEVYRPAYRNFADQGQQLKESVERLCVTAAAPQLAVVRTAYREAVRAFSVIEYYRVGPMLSDNRLNRLFYWPDKRRVGERQLRRLLSLGNSALAASTGNIAGKSVAVQGFPALERLLFASGADDQLISAAGTERCRVASVVAFNIASMATELAIGWSDDTGISRRMTLPDETDEIFRSESEVLRSFMTQIVAGIEFLVARKIEPLLPEYAFDPTADGSAKARRRMPFWKSELYLVNLQGNLQGLRALVLDSGLAARADLENELGFEFRTAATYLASLAAMDRLVIENSLLVADAESLLAALSSVLRSIQLTASDRLASGLGVHAGFNSDDGD